MNLGLGSDHRPPLRLDRIEIVECVVLSRSILEHLEIMTAHSLSLEHGRETVVLLDQLLGDSVALAEVDDERSVDLWWSRRRDGELG